MVKTSLCIRWPLDEPQWIDFQEDFVVFGDVDFIRHWEGVDSSLWDSYIKDAFNQQWHRLIPSQAGWLVGDMPGLLAPSMASDTASGTGENRLAIWELVSAQDGFVMPAEVVLSPALLGESVYSTNLETRKREFRLFPSRESGETVIARRDLPIFYFGDADSKLEVFPIRLTADGREGEFLLHLFSHGFDHCTWQV